MNGGRQLNYEKIFFHYKQKYIIYAYCEQKYIIYAYFLIQQSHCRYNYRKDCNYAL